LRQSIVDKIHQNSVKSENERTLSRASSFRYLNDSDKDSNKNVNLDGFVDDDFEDVILLAPADGFENASTDVLLEWGTAIGNTQHEIEIASDATFTDVVESLSVNGSSYTPTLLDNNSTYFWRVKPKNDCGEGDFSEVFSFGSTIELNGRKTEDLTKISFSTVVFRFYTPKISTIIIEQSWRIRTAVDR
jgi:hypothetical protein